MFSGGQSCNGSDGERTIIAAVCEVRGFQGRNAWGVCGGDTAGGTMCNFVAVFDAFSAPEY